MLFSSYHAKQQAVIHHSGIQQALGSHHNTLQMRYPTSFLRLHTCSQPSETLFTGLLTRDRSIAGHFITYHLLQPLHFSPFIHVLQVSHSSFFVLFFYHAHISFILPLFRHSIARLYWKNSAGPWQPFLCTTYSHYLPLGQAHIIWYWQSAFLLFPCLF